MVNRLWGSFFAIMIVGVGHFLPAPTQGNPVVSVIPAGGATTLEVASGGAFTLPAPNLGSEQLKRHLEGDLAFEAKFVAAPAPINAGLGPRFNNVSCISCHVANGRGRPDKFGTAISSLILRVSLPGQRADGGPLPVPGVGNQLADRAIYGERPDAKISVSYEEFPVEMAGGDIVNLQRPTYHIDDSREPLPQELLVSPRAAPPVFGRGLLEAIPEADILAKADPDDRDGDGISGRVNRVWNPITKRHELGRFGLKANNATLLAQSASAYLGDMGVVAPPFAGPPPDGTDAEIDWKTLHDATFYVQTLAVPARRDTDDPFVAKGERLFQSMGCASCHTPTWRTGEFTEIEELANQEFAPYTDLLLHDMGDGLADNRPDFEAGGTEWRTPPLWGLGLTKTVSGHTFLLHDARARNNTEAILWHGGEAENSREAFRLAQPTDREALLAFLKSL